MTTLHVVSHTHWDREWYLTFQQFRLKLVRLIDDLLAILENDPEFRCYLLDGQTIILDDYLAIRPQAHDRLQRYIREDRLQIGPWYVLPDEFLVGQESLIRNLLEGERSARRFGKKMELGYIPDPFGHVGQMPQILAGFGIQSAAVQRGLDDQPCEFWWQSPDGSRVLMAYLRDGYGNAAALPTHNPAAFLDEVIKTAGRLDPFCATNQRLLMHGTDHMPAQAGTSRAIAYAQAQSSDFVIRHSSLPEYIRSVQDEVARSALQLPTIRGELRSGKRYHLLPGVLSTRAWIKQRNHACETLLTKWTEPFLVFWDWAGRAAENGPEETPPAAAFDRPEDLLHYAWRLLMECHPHDSICGCSIDQVHDEMRTRFDQVEQIGEELTRQSLDGLVLLVDTTPPERIQGQSVAGCILVFNPNDIPCAGETGTAFHPSGGWSDYRIVDENGAPVPFEITRQTSRRLAVMDLDRQALFSMIGELNGGSLTGLAVPEMTIQDIHLEQQGQKVDIRVALSDIAPPDPGAMERVIPMAAGILADETVQDFHVLAEVPTTEIVLLAPQVPAHGYRTCWVVKAPPVAAGLEAAAQPAPTGRATSLAIENEFFRVEASASDGALVLHDLRRGFVYPGLNRFVDGGDCGDTYNYCPPEEDRLLGPARPTIQKEIHPTRQSLVLEMEIEAPKSLAPDRRSRASETRLIRIKTTAVLLPGLPRLDIHTEVDNPCEDHRLRVHFPAPFHATHAAYDGAFDVDRRAIGLPDFDETWIEAPRPEKPQRNFTALVGEQAGLLVANLGLREAEALERQDGAAEIALTLLRCVGWLSRDDFPLRKGHAGPGLPTPGAQMPGGWSFDYSVVPFAPGQQAHAYQLAHAFSAPLRAAPTSAHLGFLPHTLNFFAVSPETFVVSALKFAEDRSGWILRGYNPTGRPLNLSLKTCRSFSRVELANLAEQPLQTLSFEPEAKTLELAVAPYQIVTLKFSA